MKVDYGIDAPTVVRNLAIGGLASLLLAVFRIDIRLGPVIILHTGWYFAAAGMLGASACMFYYSRSANTAIATACSLRLPGVEMSAFWTSVLDEGCC